MAGVSVRNLTRRRQAPRFPYPAVAKKALGAWDVSLVFVDPAQARKLNKELRGKTYVPNVLSYAAGASSGEVIICLSEAKRQAPAHGMDERTFVLYLFIHGLLHLKGARHGATMERCERELLAKFAKGGGRAHALHDTTNRNRHRHRHAPGKTGRGRRALG